MNLIRTAALATGLSLASMGAHAQVDTALVATQQSVQPGGSITVALRLTHQPHWHSFWVNAGTGLPTRIEWKLPPGWTAGEIQWPVPIVLKDKQGIVSGHGYEGLTYLPVTLRAPADAQVGRVAALRGTARWLMCDTVCIPGKAELMLDLPVTAQAGAAQAETVAGIAKMSFPEAGKGWKFAAGKGSGGLQLHVAAPMAVRDLHFFALSKQLPYQAPQTPSVTGPSPKVTLKLPALAPAEGEAAITTLEGVLAYRDGSGAYRGVQVKAPLQPEQAAAGAMGLSPDVASGGPAPADSSLSLAVLGLALLGGLVLNLMPCVFPVLGLKIMGFVQHAGSDRRKVTMHGLAFTAGVLLSFWTLAGLLAALRAGGQQLGWGFQLQSPSFVFGLAAVMLIFAMNLSGLFEVGVRATAIGSDLHTREGMLGTFFSGVLATVVATPCSAPFLAPALGTALALPTAQSFVVFTAIAIGLSLPYLLLSMFPSAVRFLPRPGRWMETFKQLMAFPLYATVAYLIWVLAGQASEKALLNALLGLTAVAMAGWLYGRYAGAGASAGSLRMGTVGGLALLVAALGFGWPRSAPATDIQWEPWSAERIAALQKEGRPIYVDFTARWCATCQVNKNVVFSSAEVKDYFRANRVAAVKADWTNNDPLITAELAKWNRSAIPFNLVYLPGQPKAIDLPELLTPGIVLDAFKASRGAALARNE